MEIKEIKKFFNINLLKPTSIKLIIKDLLKIKNQTYSTDYHLKKLIKWLIYAQSITKDGGVSKGFSLTSGWQSSYMETSGYILNTLFDFFILKKNPKILYICKEIANWECSVQLQNGSYRGGVISQKKQPGIFITGQVLSGLCYAYKIFKDENFLNHAIKAADFIVKNQDEDGAWRVYCAKHSPESFNARSAWALLKLYEITQEERYKSSAIKNLNWVMTQRNENFWFNNNDTIAINYPYLHFISYTIRGLLESGVILQSNEYIYTARNSALRLLERFKKKVFLPARFNSNWESKDNFSCLTGDAQISIIWLRLYQIFKEKKFLTNALQINRYLKSKQVNSKFNKNIDGAIPGSDPIWGNYSRYKFPNWAAKFFCDALILEKKILDTLNNNEKFLIL